MNSASPHAHTRLLRAAFVLVCGLIAAESSQAQSFLPPVRRARKPNPVQLAPTVSDREQPPWALTNFESTDPTSEKAPEITSARDNDPSVKTEDLHDPAAELEAVDLDAPSFATVNADDEATDANTEAPEQAEAESTEATPLDSSKLKLNEPVPLEDTLEKVFAINDSAMTWIVRGDKTDGIGFFSLESEANKELQLDVESNFNIEMQTGIHWVSGPGRTDLPARLYDFMFSVHVRTEELFQISTPGDELGVRVDALFDLGIHSDFEDSAREGWRFPGRVLLVGDSKLDGLWYVAGFELLDLDHIQMLPAAGVVAQNDDAVLELYFPRPRVKLRIDEDESSEQWLYLLGEYRGRAWAIERVTGNADVATLSEYRLAFGVESHPKPDPEADEEEEDDLRVSFLEFNWLFGRDLEYRTGIGNYQPGDTFMLRWGSRY